MVFLKTHRIQPYLQLGLILTATMNVKDGAANASTVSDGQFRGFFGFDYGAGISFYPTPSVALTAGVVNRYMSLSQARGTGEWKKYENGLSIDGSQFNIGVAYTF
jgi:opacity protein-like surface antigen